MEKIPPYLLRFKEVKTYQLINKLQERTKLTKSDIINRALDIALPIMEHQYDPENLISFASEKEEKLESITLNLKKVLESCDQIRDNQMINFAQYEILENIIGSLYSRFKKYYNENPNVSSLSSAEENIMDFRLPEQFAQKKAKLIKIAIEQK